MNVLKFCFRDGGAGESGLPPVTKYIKLRRIERVQKAQSQLLGTRIVGGHNVRVPQNLGSKKRGELSLRRLREISLQDAIENGTALRVDLVEIDGLQRCIVGA